MTSGSMQEKECLTVVFVAMFDSLDYSCWWNWSGPNAGWAI